MKITIHKTRIDATADTTTVSAVVFFRVRDKRIVPEVIFTGSGDKKTLRRLRAKIIALLRPLVVKFGKAEITIVDDRQAVTPGWIQKPQTPGKNEV